MTGESREGSQSIDLSKVIGSPDADAKVRINISRRPEATGPLKGLSGLCPEYRFQAKPKGGLPHTLASFFHLMFNRPPAFFFLLVRERKGDIGLRGGAFNFSDLPRI